MGGEAVVDSWEVGNDVEGGVVGEERVKRGQHSIVVRVESMLLEGYFTFVQDVLQRLGWELTELAASRNLPLVPKG